MNPPSLKLPLSVEAYIEGELHSEVKHEYLAGKVYAMSGASRSHNIITPAISALPCIGICAVARAKCS